MANNYKYEKIVCEKCGHIQKFKITENPYKKYICCTVCLSKIPIK